MGIKISGFYDEVSGDLKTQLELCKKLGEQYICPRIVNGKNIANYTLEEFEKDIKPMLDEYGVKFSSIGSPTISPLLPIKSSSSSSNLPAATS